MNVSTKNESGTFELNMGTSLYRRHLIQNVDSIYILMDFISSGPILNFSFGPKTTPMQSCHFRVLNTWWFSVGICKYKPGYKSHDLL